VSSLVLLCYVARLAPHSLNKTYSLRGLVRNRLHSHLSMELGLPVVCRTAFFSQSRFVFMDAYPVLRHRRPFPVRAQVSLPRPFGFVRLIRLLLFHVFLPGLGRHLILWQPFFRLPHGAVHSWPFGAFRVGRLSVS